MGNLAWILGGIVTGGIIHILCIFGIPPLAEHNAWSRLSPVLKPNTLVVADGKTVPNLPFTPPDVINAYCLYNISERNVAVRSPLPDASWSLALSTRAGENFYIVTGADTKKSETRLLIVRHDRLAEEAASGKTDEGDDQNIVVSPAETGFVVIRAPIRGESFRAQTIIEIQKARCEIQPEPVVAAVAEPSGSNAKEDPLATQKPVRRREPGRRREF